MSWLRGSASPGLFLYLAVASGCGRADRESALLNGEAGSGGASVRLDANGGAGLAGDGAASGGVAVGGVSSGGSAMGGTTAAAGSAGSGREAVAVSAGGASGAAGFCSTVHHVEIPLNLFNARVSFASYTIGRVGDRFSVVEEGDVSTGDHARAVSLISWQGTDAHWECTSGCPVGYATIITPDVGGPQMLFEDSTYAKAWDTSGNLLGSTLLYFPEVANIQQGIQTTGAQYQFKTSKDGRRALWAFGFANFSPVGCLAQVRENAKAAGPPGTLALEPWACLSVLPTQASAALSLASKAKGDDPLDWAIRELDAAGSISFESTVTVPSDPGARVEGCPQVIEGPAGYYARFQRRILSMSRTAGGGTPPGGITIDSAKDRLVAIVDDEFLFEVRDTRVHFAGVDSNGKATRDWFALPDTAKVPSSEMAFVAAQGRSVFVTYRSGDNRVFEEVACPK